MGLSIGERLGVLERLEGKTVEDFDAWFEQNLAGKTDDDNETYDRAIAFYEFWGFPKSGPTEVYDSVRGPRVNIGTRSYPLKEGGGVPLQGRQLAAARRGEYGRTLKEYVLACEENGIENIGYAYTGIVNGMGDHAEAKPPWKARMRDAFKTSRDQEGDFTGIVGE